MNRIADQARQFHALNHHAVYSFALDAEAHEAMKVFFRQAHRLDVLTEEECVYALALLGDGRTMSDRGWSLDATTAQRAAVLQTVNAYGDQVRRAMERRN